MSSLSKNIGFDGSSYESFSRDFGRPVLFHGDEARKLGIFIMGAAFRGPSIGEVRQRFVGSGYRFGTSTSDPDVNRDLPKAKNIALQRFSDHELPPSDFLSDSGTLGQGAAGTIANVNRDAAIPVAQ